MAAIDKICEFSGAYANADYNGHPMYGWKRKHIQICPKYRKLFRGAKASLVFAEDNRDNGFSIRTPYGISTIWTDVFEYQDSKAVDESDELIYGDVVRLISTGVLYAVMKPKFIKTGFLSARLEPIKEIKRYTYTLKVTDPALLGEVNGEYSNYCYQGEIGDVIRRMKRLVGSKNLTVKHIKGE